jgi:hypothetical protein
VGDAKIITGNAARSAAKFVACLLSNPAKCLIITAQALDRNHFI